MPPGDQARNAVTLSCRKDRCESGTVLLLVPVGVLIVVLLAGITVDSTAAFLAEREASAAASSLANDLATLAVDESGLRRTGMYRIDPARLRSLSGWVDRAVAERLSAVFVAGSVTADIEPIGPTAVRVTVSGSARRVIGLIGGVNGARHRFVSAQATAQIHVSG